MNDELDDRAQRWLRDQGEPDPTALEVVIGRIDTLPPRRRDRLSGRQLVVAAVVVVLLASLPALLGGNAGPRGGTSGSSGASPTPPDPAAFAGDPRLKACFEGAFPVEFVFEMTHARDYRRHFAAMGRSPELDVDDPAFVVVFAAGAGPWPITGAAPDPRASPGPTASPTPETGRSVCVLVGDTPNLYAGVDITGMTVTLPGETSAPASPSSPASAPPSPTPASIVVPGPTVAPAPAWAADLLGQLQCDGPPQSIGGETGEIAGETGSPLSPEAALAAFAAQTLFTSVPARGYERAALEPHWARFEHRVDGRIRAIVILTDAGPDLDPGVWTAVGLRACDPAEFAPAAGVTGALSTVWLDGGDRRVMTTLLSEIVGPGHCGWDSTIWLRLDGSLFIRDPRGVLRADTAGRYEPRASLPKTARSTGYHEAGRTIWRVPTDPDSIYMVTAGGVERWPRAVDPFMGCM